MLKIKDYFADRKETAFGKNKTGSFFLHVLGFTNTCHVNEVGAISVVPGAWIVLRKKLHVRERQG